MDRFLDARRGEREFPDGLFAASGQLMETEELTLDPDARRGADTFVSLGSPTRSWMLSSLSNERDRPSLALPRAQSIADVLEAFGWTASRQSPVNTRESDPNVLQPGVLANSTVSVWATRAAPGSALADLAVAAATPDALVDSVFLRFYSRYPTRDEKLPLTRALAQNFSTRLVPASEIKSPLPPSVLPTVSWGNHLQSEANRIKIDLEQRYRVGPPGDPRLRPEWREVFEDVVWSLVNIREFVWLP